MVDLFEGGLERGQSEIHGGVFGWEVRAEPQLGGSLVGKHEDTTVVIVGLGG